MNTPDDHRARPGYRSFVRAVVLTAEMLETGLGGVLQAEAGLTLAELDLLDSLADEPEGRLRMTDVSDRLLVSKAGVTRLVDRLEARGLVERAPCPSDRRVVWSLITDAGAAALHSALPVAHRSLEENVGTRLDADVLARTSSALDSLSEPAAASAAGSTAPAAG